MCKRGDIYFVDFGQNIDTCKQSGIRPAVIVSNNRANEHSPVITVVPLTSKIYKKRMLPTHVYIGDRGTRSFKQLNELFAGNGMIGFVAKERVDGKLILPEAVQVMKLSEK